MGKVKSDLESYLHGSPHTPESEKFLYTLKGYAETLVGKDQQTIKINFFRLYEESINRINHQRMTEEEKHNQIRRFEEIKEFAERWIKAQEIFKFFYERQLEQTEALKAELLNYLDLMAKQEMLAKAIFLINLIKLLDEKIIQIEHKIEELEKKSEMIHDRIVHTATQLFMDTLPAELKNSPQAKDIKQHYADRYSAELLEIQKSNLPYINANRDIASTSAKIALKSIIKNSKIVSEYHEEYIKKIDHNQNLIQDLASIQDDRSNLKQQKAELQKKMEQKNILSQVLAKISPEVQALARTVLSDKTPATEQLNQGVTASKNSNNSTVMMSAKLSMPLKVLATEEEDFSMYEDESSSQTPQSNITESIPSQDNLKDKESTKSKTQKEVPEEPDPTLGLKPK